MRTDYIKTALKVAETGHFRAAGIQLALTHSSVMYQVKSLEKELGFLLFVHAAGRFNQTIPTEQGAKWLTCARKAMEWLEQGKSKVGSSRRKE